MSYREALRLSPHPEGGWFRETWRSGTGMPADGGTQALATAIHYRLRPAERSRWHRVRSPELWLWQGGGTLTLRLGGTGAGPRESARRRLGPDPDAGHDLLWLVAPGEWQAAEPAGLTEVLVACVVAPGFDRADFELAPG
jgi:predicted cupin superfamily sugar epimerase